MTKQLNIDEMLDVLSDLGHPAYSALRGMVEAAADQCAEAIKEVVPGIETGKASFEGTAFAGTCVAFWSATPKQPCPLVLRDFDSMEWSDAEGNDLDPETGEVLA